MADPQKRGNLGCVLLAISSAVLLAGFVSTRREWSRDTETAGRLPRPNRAVNFSSIRHDARAAGPSSTVTFAAQNTLSASPTPAIPEVDPDNTPERRQRFFETCLAASQLELCRPGAANKPLVILPRDEWRNHLSAILDVLAAPHVSTQTGGLVNRWNGSVHGCPLSMGMGCFEGPWIENHVISMNLAGPDGRIAWAAGGRHEPTLDRLEGIYYPVVPLFAQWTDNHVGDDRTFTHMNKDLFRLAGTDGSPLRRNVLYMAVSQHDRGDIACGLKCDEYAQVITVAAGGWGNVAVPLIKDAHDHTRAVLGDGWQARQRSYVMSFVGTPHFGRDEMISAFKQSMPTGEPPFFFNQEGFHDWLTGLNNTIFALAPRGYGRSSFRQSEILQTGSVPVVLSDDYLWLAYSNFADLVEPGSLKRYYGVATDAEANALHGELGGYVNAPSPSEVDSGGHRYSPLSDAELSEFRASPDARTRSGPVPYSVPRERIEKDILNHGGTWGPGGVGFAVTYRDIPSFVCVACEFVKPGSAERWRHVRTVPLWRYGQGEHQLCPCSSDAWRATVESISTGGRLVLPPDSLVAEMERRVQNVSPEYFTYESAVRQIQGFFRNPFISPLRCAGKTDNYGVPADNEGGPIKRLLALTTSYIYERYL